jgi:GT2 family glycosyltransferase
MDDRLSNGGPLVSIVVVTWNSAPFLRRSLEGIRAQTYQPVEVIVVDNASEDHGVAMCRDDAFTIIRNTTNRGFSAAVNQAIARARGEFVLLCNPDAYLGPRYVAEIVAAMKADPNIGSATGTLMREEGSVIDTAGIRMTRSGRHLDIQSFSPRRGEKVREARMRGRPQGPSPGLRPPSPAGAGEGAVNEVFGASGAAGMYRMSFLRDVAIDGEIFDEDFFAFREDADIAWRGRLLGWRSIHVPSAVGTHVRRVTPERRRELPPEINMHSVKNRFLLRLKNEGPLLALLNAPFEIGRDLVVIAAVLTVERSSLPALRWLWKNRERVMRKRRIIQQRRRVSDLALAKWFR